MRPGEDVALKTRLAGLSGEAARVLGAGTMRPCADVRVRQAVAAALADPALSPKGRREVAGVAEELASDEPDTSARALTLRFRATEEEADQIRARSEAAGLTLSDYLRRAALGVSE